MVIRVRKGGQRQQAKRSKSQSEGEPKGKGAAMEFAGRVGFSAHSVTGVSPTITFQPYNTIELYFLSEAGRVSCNILTHDEFETVNIKSIF